MIDARRYGNGESRWQVVVDAVSALITHTFHCRHDLGQVAHVLALAEGGELNGLRDYREPCQADADDEAEDPVEGCG